MTIGRWVLVLSCLVALASAATAWRLILDWDEEALTRALVQQLGPGTEVERPRLVLVPSPRLEIDRLQSSQFVAEGVRVTPRLLSLVAGHLELAAVDARRAAVQVAETGLPLVAPQLNIASLTLGLPGGQHLEGLTATFETRDGQRRFTLASSTVRVEGMIAPGAEPTVSATISAFGSTARLSGVLRGRQLDGRLRAEVQDPAALLTHLGLAEPPGMLRAAGVLEGEVRLEPARFALTSASYSTGLLRLTGRVQVALAAPQVTIEVAVPSLVIDHLLQVPGRLGSAPVVPVHLRLSAETARWRGGPVRGLVLEAVSTTEGIRIPWAEAHLPGELHVAFSDGRWAEDRLEGRLEFGADDLRRPLGWWLGAAPALPPALARDAAGVAQVDWTARRLVLREMDVSLGDSRIDGAVTLAAPTGAASRVRLDLALRVDQLTVPEVLVPTVLPRWDGWVDLVIERLTVADISLHGLRISAGAEGGVVVLDHASATWEGQSASLQGTVFAEPAPARFAGQLRLGGADVAVDASATGVSADGTIDWRGQPMLVRGPVWPTRALLLASQDGSVSMVLKGVDPTEVVDLVAGPLSANGRWRGSVLAPATATGPEGRGHVSLNGRLRAACPLPLVLARCIGVALPDGGVQATIALPPMRFGPLDVTGGTALVTGSVATPRLDATLALPNGSLRLKQTDRDGRQFLIDTDALPLVVQPLLADLGIEGVAQVAGSIAVGELGATGTVSGTAEGISLAGDLVAVADALVNNTDAAVPTALSTGRTTFARAAVRLEVRGAALDLLTLTAAGPAGQITLSQEGDVVRLLVRAADAAGRVVEQRWTRHGGRGRAITLVDGVAIPGGAP